MSTIVELFINHKQTTKMQHIDKEAFMERIAEMVEGLYEEIDRLQTVALEQTTQIQDLEEEVDKKTEEIKILQKHASALQEELTPFIEFPN